MPLTFELDLNGLFSYIFYQTRLHPLACYPGLIFAKLTDLYSVFHAFCGNRHEVLYRLHQRYGRIVHARKRRIMSHALSEQAHRSMEPLILSDVHDWCLALGDRHPNLVDSDNDKTEDQDWSQPKDMAHWCACVIPSAALRILKICGQMPILSHIGSKKWLRMGTAADHKRQIAFSRQQLQAHDPDTGEGCGQHESISGVSLQKPVRCPPSSMACADTANAALTATLYFLTHHPRILSRLTTQIRNAFPTLEAIAPGARLSSLTYLRACIDESMRLCPPVPIVLPREVLPGGLQVGDAQFPAGTVHFARPFVYDSYRWMVRHVSPETLAIQRQAFVPFGLGLRACIGRKVALTELEVSIAQVLFMYDVRLAPWMEHLGVGRGRKYKIKKNFVVGQEEPVL
ncbi:cytochrome P450 [Aspergillus stella-maris]|uniref:cytochrome P450 n=1 Tax=Aspergillus stella-maris TaxID=1810926 RepID=UPI003CCD0C06